MAARALWKAELDLGPIRLPVRMYSAVEDAKVHFRLLHRDDLAPVEQVMVDPRDERVVSPDEIRRGYEVKKRKYVLLREPDWQRLEPEPSRLIAVEQVVPAAEIDARWFDRPYYLGPDGDDEAYFALADALAKRGRVGIARWVLRKKNHHGALLARHGYLMVATLRSAGEIIDVGRISPPTANKPDKRELALAHQLVESLADDFDPSRYHDAYQAELRRLIEAKAKGGAARRKPPRARTRRSEGSLADELQASLGSQGKVAHAG